MNLKLIVPDEKYLSSVRTAIKEYKAKPSEFEIHAVSKMIDSEQNNFADYFKNTENESLGISLKQGYVAHTVFWLMEDDEYIGTFDLRHSLTPALEKIGGHIAYQIRPSKYRRGYAYEGLKLCLEKAFQKGIESALITCKEQNTASYNVMQKAVCEYGGYEDEMLKKDDISEKRIWIKTHK